MSGFLAAAITSASQIPQVGWRETRKRVECFALDPVAQYLFYCSLLVLWTNGITSSTMSKIAKSAAAAAAVGGSGVEEKERQSLQWVERLQE